MTGSLTTTTVVAHDREELAAARADLTGRTAVVMTMGALHEGHATLIRQARELADEVIVTIFLNPLQFAPGEDLGKYPRTFDDDLVICRREHVGLVFAPTPDVVYPDGDPSVRVSAGPLGDRLEGASRPGHFDGVLTVVAKLMHLTRPDVALYGDKDAQQLALIATMVRDLDLGVEVVGVPTVRDLDGLALSSRNRYLDTEDRTASLALSRALLAGCAETARGPEAVVVAASSVLSAEPGVRLDYLTLVDATSWQPADERTRDARLLVAAYVGSTRLIDNMRVDLGAASCS